MNKLVLCWLLVGCASAQTPLELNLPNHLQNLARNIPARCVEHSVTPVLCTKLSNSDALMPHPDDCQLFYYCEQEGAAPTCRQCPADLHFNPALHVCDWPQSAGCTATPGATTISPNYTTGPISSTTTLPISDETALPSVTWPWITLPASNTTDEPISYSTIPVPTSTVTSNSSWPFNVTWPWWPTNATGSPDLNSSTWSPYNVSATLPSNATLPSGTTSTHRPASRNSTSAPVQPTTRTTRSSSPSSTPTLSPSTTKAPSNSTPTVRTLWHITIRWQLLN